MINHFDLNEKNTQQVTVNFEFLFSPQKRLKFFVTYQVSYSSVQTMDENNEMITVYRCKKYI